MGLSFSKEPRQHIVCHVDERKLEPDEFQISLDAQAFEFHMLSPVKMLRVTVLDLEGHWGQTISDIFTKQRPYEDEYVLISPNGSPNGTSNNGPRSIKVTIKEPESVQMLYQSARVRPKTILCHRGESPYVYVQLTLKKQMLPEGTYELGTSCFLLCGGPKGYILIVSLPDDGVTIRPNMNQVMERANLDPSLLFFASQPLEGMSAPHHASHSS
jgi:hypothetical protein